MKSLSDAFKSDTIPKRRGRPPKGVEPRAELMDEKPELPAYDSLTLYMNEINKTPLLTPEQEIELAARIKKGGDNGDIARDLMITANLRLVVKIAYSYNNCGLPLPDLISEGNIGLSNAVDRFDPEKGGKLSTYAAWWIKQSIKRALANQSKTIRLPVHLVDKIAKMRKITRELTEELGREPEIDEIAEAMDTSPEKVANWLNVSTKPASLNAPIGEKGEATFGDMIEDIRAESPAIAFDQSARHQYLREHIEKLDEREQDIIMLRFDLDGNGGCTLEEVGEKYSITRERVRQIETIALRKLRKMMEGEDDPLSKEQRYEEKLKKARAEVLAGYSQEEKKPHSPVELVKHEAISTFPQFG